MNHVDAPKSKSAWVHTILDSPPLIMMGNQKKNVNSKDKVGLF
jgi:hypothetical protein